MKKKLIIAIIILLGFLILNQSVRTSTSAQILNKDYFVPTESTLYFVNQDNDTVIQEWSIMSDGQHSVERQIGETGFETTHYQEVDGGIASTFNEFYVLESEANRKQVISGTNMVFSYVSEGEGWSTRHEYVDTGWGHEAVVEAQYLFVGMVPLTIGGENTMAAHIEMTLKSTPTVTNDDAGVGNLENHRKSSFSTQKA